MVTMLSTELKKLSEETEAQFICRLAQIKKVCKLTWKNIADIANSELKLNYSESWYRRNFKQGLFSDNVVATTTSCSSDCDSCLDETKYLCECEISEAEYESKLDKKLVQIMQKRVEVIDLVSSNNAMIRRLSREQTIKDIAHDFAKEMSDVPLILPKNCKNVETNVEGILLISDWHYGLLCDNYWNKFDPTICKERVSKLLSKVISYIKLYNLQKLTVLDLSDLIAGRIHSQIRIESRFDVITQTMEVSEILANFLSELSIYCSIDFYSCLDNHSRLEPNKKESLDLESLTRIIPWYLRERLIKNSRINICENKHGDDIITCEILGHKIIAVHGHDDSPINGLDRLSMFTREHYDMLCMAHRHHMFFEEQSEAIVLSNGCLVGVDTHSKKLRLSSKPSQTFVVVTPDNVIEGVHRLLLN